MCQSITYPHPQRALSDCKGASKDNPAIPETPLESGAKSRHFPHLFSLETHHQWVDQLPSDLPFSQFMQAEWEDAFPTPYYENGQWGFVDADNQLVIACQYDAVRWFTQGLAAISRQGRWGFVNVQGQEVIACRYQRVRPFSEALALVKRMGRWGFINTIGQEVIPCQYDYATSFSDGIAEVGLGDQISFIDATGQPILPFIAARSNGQARLR
jgi:hypothetical protein